MTSSQSSEAVTPFIVRSQVNAIPTFAFFERSSSASWHHATHIHALDRSVEAAHCPGQIRRIDGLRQLVYRFALIGWSSNVSVFSFLDQSESWSLACLR